MMNLDPPLLLYAGMSYIYNVQKGTTNKGQFLHKMIRFIQHDISVCIL